MFIVINMDGDGWMKSYLTALGCRNMDEGRCYLIYGPRARLPDSQEFEEDMNLLFATNQYIAMRECLPL